MKKKLILYTFFAILASFANLLTQRLVLSISKINLFYFLAITSGTLVGLIIKFFLDKSLIFFDKTKDIKSLGRKFTIYSTMGIFTTSIFWATETIFWLIWRQENMREMGAILGLMLGYILKYRLDKRYVFGKT
jgi:putative flippase GtrA